MNKVRYLPACCTVCTCRIRPNYQIRSVN